MLFQQYPDVVRKDVRAASITHIQTQAPLPVENVTSGRVVHRIILRTLTGHLLVYHLEFLCHTRCFDGIAAQCQKSGIERSNVLREQFRGISFRIDCDQHHLYLIGRRSELPQRGGEFRQRGRRAEIRVDAFRGLSR